MAEPKRIKGLKKWLKEHNYTEEQMQAWWDELIEINSTVKALHNSGFNWDQTNLSILEQIPTEKERTLRRLEEKRIKEEQEKAEKESKALEKEYYEEHFEEIIVQKIDKKEPLTEKELRILVYEYEYSKEEGANNRWTRSMYTVVNLCNRFFMVNWHQALTEYQEDEFMYQPYEVELHEYEKTIIVKEWVKKGDN